MNTWGQLLLLLASVGTGRAAAVGALLAQPWGQETSHLRGGRAWEPTQHRRAGLRESCMEFSSPSAP